MHRTDVGPSGRLLLESNPRLGRGRLAASEWAEGYRRRKPRCT